MGTWDDLVLLIVPIVHPKLACVVVHLAITRECAEINLQKSL